MVLPYAAVFPHTAGIRARGRPVIQAEEQLGARRGTAASADATLCVHRLALTNH